MIDHLRLMIPWGFLHSLHMLTFSCWIITCQLPQGKKEVHGGSKLLVDFTTDCVCERVFHQVLLQYHQIKLEKEEPKGREEVEPKSSLQRYVIEPEKGCPASIENAIFKGYLHRQICCSAALECFAVHRQAQTHRKTHSKNFHLFLNPALTRKAQVFMRLGDGNLGTARLLFMLRK